MVAKPPGKRSLDSLAQKFGLGAGVWNTSDSVLENISQPDWIEEHKESDEKETELIEELELEMRQAADRLDFERAARLRDRIFRMKNATN